ncbi:SIR2 family protein, partial [Patescibacteria group bacterium]|nr:SIR2 family protein [Patescibacteria group bacterium]
MDTGLLNKLADIIAMRKCVLFAGSGLTAESGGALWSQLVEHLETEFRYSSPLQDNFEKLEDMDLKYGPKSVYQKIQLRLKGATLVDPIKKLSSLPWFTVFTTNYDTALEDSLGEMQIDFNVRTICTGNEFPVTGLQSEILCVKLMGSVDVEYGQPGAMVVDPGDYTVAKEDRIRIFDILANHAAHLSFLFIGYSFDDLLFLDVLRKLNKVLGKTNNIHYAVFKEEPEPEKKYLLNQYGVKIIVCDLKNFSSQLDEKASERSSVDYKHKKIPVGKEVIRVESRAVGSFLSKYEPVFVDKLQEPVDPFFFFKGYTESLNPFLQKWHFERRDSKKIVDIVTKNKNEQTNIIYVEGSPGSGRTFIILSSVCGLITEHMSLAIRISPQKNNPIPDNVELEEFLQELRRVSAEAFPSFPTNIIFWSETPLENVTIAEVGKLGKKSDVPISLICEDTKIPPEERKKFPECKNFHIDANVTLSGEIKKELQSYLLDVIKQIRSEEISTEKVEEVILSEKQFLPIMYRTIDPSQRSINQIIEDDFTKIENENVKRYIEICSIATFFGRDIPLFLLRKTYNSVTGQDASITDVFDIAKQEGKDFVKVTENVYKESFFSIFHDVVAEHLIHISDNNKLEDILIRIAENIDLKSRLEASFIGNMLIANVVNRPTHKPL